MDTFNQIIDTVLRGYTAVFGWAPLGVRLAILSALAGVGMLWVFRKTSNQERIRAVKRRVQAHLLELRVYRDEPVVSWRAQKSLLWFNLRYIALMLQPALWMGLPLAVLLVHLESYYGRAPLEIGRATIVTVGMESPLERPVLIAPPGIAVETPPVRVLDRHEVSWRIRPLRPVSGELRIVAGGRTISKRVEAGVAGRFVPGLRAGSVWSALWHPGEPRIGPGPVDWIDIRYPEARIALLGIRMHWLAWFTIVSMVAALLLKKQFRVTL